MLHFFAVGVLFLAQQGGSPVPDPQDPLHQGADMRQGKSLSGSIRPDEFVSKAGIDCMTQIQLGETARRKAQNESVRQFAGHVVAERRQVCAELRLLADRNHFSLPPALDAEHRNVVKAMRANEGADFDAAFAAAMVKVEEEAIPLYQSGAGASNPDISAFANRTLAELMTDRKRLDALQANLRDPGSH